jgi:hypothetical protein
LRVGPGGGGGGRAPSLNELRGLHREFVSLNLTGGVLWARCLIGYGRNIGFKGFLPLGNIFCLLYENFLK